MGSAMQPSNCSAHWASAAAEATTRCHHVLGEGQRQCWAGSKAPQRLAAAGAGRLGAARRGRRSAEGVASSTTSPLLAASDGLGKEHSC